MMLKELNLAEKWKNSFRLDVLKRFNTVSKQYNKLKRKDTLYSRAFLQQKQLYEKVLAVIDDHKTENL